MSCRLVKRYCAGSTSFNGTTSTIPTDITANTAFTSGFVLHGWIKPRSGGENTEGRLFDKSTGTGGQNGIRLCMRYGQKALGMTVNAGTQVDTAYGVINYNRWYHVIAHVASDATVSFYINGVLSGTPAATGALSGITTSNPLTIGNRSTATDRTFDGNLAELGIISLAGRGDLTAEEIKALYTNSVKPTGNAHFFPLSDLPSTYLDTVGGATGTGTATTYSTDVPTQLPVAIDTEARSSLSFDGATSGVDGVQLVNADIDSYTLYAQAMVKTAGNHCIVYRMLGDGSNRSPRILINSSWVGTFSIRLNDNGTNTNYNIAVSNVRLFGITPNKWFTVILRVKNGEQTLFINGIKAGSGVGVGIPTWNTLAYKIGYDDNVNYRLNGFVKRVCFWTNKYFSDEEIKNLHFKNVVPYKDDPTKLVLNLKLNEGAGDIAYDSSGNGNNATISGATWSTNTPTKPRTLVTTPRTIAVNRTNITC